jgi:mannose-6-phosphate isomerase-like protein (cupin superfamily)
MFGVGYVHCFVSGRIGCVVAQTLASSSPCDRWRAEAMDARVIKREELPADEISHDLIGADHGGVGISMIFVDAPPGRGPRLHKHPYEEIFIVLEGEAEFVAGDSRLTASAGEVVIVPPETPHSFTSSGSRRLRQIDIHVSSSFITEWL